MPVPETTDRVRVEALAERVVAFSRTLREHGVPTTTGRTIDAVRSLAHVRLHDADEMRLAMRANLTSSREEAALFDRLFAAWWAAPMRGSSDPLVADDSAATKAMAGAEIGAPASDASDDTRECYGRGIADRPPDLRAGWPGGSKEFDAAVAALLRRLATRPSRRYRPAQRGPRIDLRGSLRASVRHGFEILAPAHLRRRTRKTRAVLLCDVSGSMTAATPFLLRFLFAVQRGLRRSRSAVFSTRFTEVTAALRRGGIEAALDRVAGFARHWSGGTDIGAALATANRTLLGNGSTRSTVCLVVSDGFDQGDPERVAREMALVARRVRRTIWINPLLGNESYEPTARGMRAALPWIDDFLPADDASSLKKLARALREA
jgi:uncharacterized protein